MTATVEINWWEVDRQIKDLETDMLHGVAVQREAIPLVFVPGIMGTRLRRAGAAPTADGNDKNDGPDGLPNVRWEPGKKGWMAMHYLYRGPEYRKRMIIGPDFDPDRLEVANAEPLGNGFSGLMEDYRPFLETLRNHPWGPIGKVFEFPVYAVGYNWTDSAETAGSKLSARIQNIIREAKSVMGACETVILVSHSMGGLVSRACCKLSGAEGSILGVVHGVQPVTGAAAAYWRIKAGFEGSALPSAVLGNDGKDVTVILGNSPGGLQLLPNQLYRTNAGAVAWLRVTKDSKVIDGLALPKGDPPDPYQEIYSIPAVVSPKDSREPSNNAYWALVDPDLLTPGQTTEPADAGSIDAETAVGVQLPWDQYVGHLAVAKSFHERLRDQAHPNSFCFAGSGQATAEQVELKAEWRATPITNYRTRGFAGEYTSADGWDMKAILQPPAGAGDGTVPLPSAQRLNRDGKPKPGDVTLALKHQPAYENGAAQSFTIQAITALGLIRYEQMRPKK